MPGLEPGSLKINQREYEIPRYKESVRCAGSVGGGLGEGVCAKHRMTNFWSCRVH